MGYHTFITIVAAWPKSRPRYTERIDADFDEEDAITGEIDAEASDCNNLADDNDPMRAISLRHKGWIIEVECRGGDQEDLYRRRYLDGAYEQIAPVWPQYKTVLDDLETAKAAASKDAALVERLNDALAKLFASWRVMLVDGRFFTCNDAYDKVDEEVSRQWVQANVDRLCGKNIKQKTK